MEQFEIIFPLYLNLDESRIEFETGSIITYTDQTGATFKVGEKVIVFITMNTGNPMKHVGEMLERNGNKIRIQLLD